MLTKAEVDKANQFERYLHGWEWTWAFKQLLRLPHEYIALFTGNQCIFRSSKIYDPVKKTHTRIDEIKSDFHVLAWDGEKLVTAKATKPYKKEPDRFYRFDLSNGQSFKATMGHRVLTACGYRRLDSLSVDFDILTAPYLDFFKHGKPDKHDDLLHITRVSEIERDAIWDFEVVGYHNYYHAGAIHHNSMKTSSVAYQYVMRIFGHHKVPKKNILYLECSRRDRVNQAPHGFYEFGDKQTGVVLQGWEKGTWSVPFPNDPVTPLSLPADGICPFCGEKIVLHYRNSRILRFAAENLPTVKQDTGGQSSEIKSSVYPEFKKWLPDFLIKRDKSGKKMDITIRSPSITILDPNIGAVFFSGTANEIVYDNAPDIIAEFVSYNQASQSTAGVQRASMWLDEHAPFDFFDEQCSRGFAEDSDTILTLTPALGFSWEYDYIFEEADTFIRTQAVADHLSIGSKTKVPLIERTDSGRDIAVIQAATDDNPTFSPEVVAKKYANRPDPDGTVIPMRRFGIFKQASGRMFKKMNTKIHAINPKKYGIDSEFLDTCVLARAMDYHKRIPHHILWIALSSNDECFVYQEFLASPDKYVHETLAEKINELSGDKRFRLDLMDPLANEINQKTGKTDMAEINDAFRVLKRSGDGFGAHWEGWNTKGEAGRNEIKTRLENSLRVGTPFNNIVIEDGIKRRLATLWFFNNCTQAIRYHKHWRWDNYVDNRYIVSKEKKQTFEEKNSHFPMCLEAVFKDRRFRPKTVKKSFRKTKQYFQGRG